MNNGDLKLCKSIFFLLPEVHFAYLQEYSHGHRNDLTLKDLTKNRNINNFLDYLVATKSIDHEQVPTGKADSMTCDSLNHLDRLIVSSDIILV